MATRTTIAKLEQRIEAAIANLHPKPPKPRHPGIAWLREMKMRFGATQEEAEADLAEAARERHEHLKGAPSAPPVRPHRDRGGGEGHVRGGKGSVRCEAQGAILPREAPPASRREGPIPQTGRPARKDPTLRRACGFRTRRFTTWPMNRSSTRSATGCRSCASWAWRMPCPMRPRCGCSARR
jgi:hypothetical protein